MLSPMSSSASRAPSESIDCVGGRARSKTRLQRLPVDHVNRALKQARDIIFQARIVEHRPDNRRVEINQNVNVAVGNLLVARDGAEQGSVRDPMSPQVGLAFLQRPYDLIPAHDVVYTTKSARFRRRRPASQR